MQLAFCESAICKVAIVPLDVMPKSLPSIHSPPEVVWAHQVRRAGDWGMSVFNHFTFMETYLEVRYLYGNYKICDKNYVE